MANPARGEAGGAGVEFRLPGTDGRSNGLAPLPPEPGKRVLVTGGAGYIGCVLTERLLDRGYAVRVLDDLWWGEEPLAHLAERIELVRADIRDVPAHALGDVDIVIHLAGLSNDPTAEYDPDANWQMNAVATEALGRAANAHGVERFVFASSCSLYDGLPPGMHDEATPLEPRGAYAASKQYAEQALLRLCGEGLDVGIVRNGTVYGWSPRMRFDLVVNTFVKDALLKGRLDLHGGGWMWRPLVDVCDCADALIAVAEAPAGKIRGEVFNVLHSNYQIRELAMLVAGSVQLLGREVKLEEAPLPELVRDYECSNAKLSLALGFNPSRSVVHAVEELLSRIDLADLAALDDPRHYNVRWLELMRQAAVK
jgi:nucleoside-diphosphate-sugar epimerase